MAVPWARPPAYYTVPDLQPLPPHRRRGPHRVLLAATACIVAIVAVVPHDASSLWAPVLTPIAALTVGPRPHRRPLFAAVNGQEVAEDTDGDEDDGDEHTAEEIEAGLKALSDVERTKEERAAAAKAAAAAYVAGKNASGPVNDYAPKVSTWGVFERPRDISKAYGGGRNIKAGQSVPREEAEQRRRELQALIANLKKGDGVTTATMIAAQNNLTEADRFLERMDYQSAEELFRAVRMALPYRHRLAGKATLELGTILDAQGRYREAAELYKSLTRHPDGAIRKQAIRLSDSFEALRFFHYSNQTKDPAWANTIKPLLKRFSRNEVAEYHATEEDLRLAQETMKTAYALIAALFMVPLGMVACLATA